MNNFAPIQHYLPAPRSNTPKERLTRDDSPYLLPTSDDLPIWVSVALGVALYLVAGVQAIFINQRVSAWSLAGVEAETRWRWWCLSWCATCRCLVLGHWLG